MITPKNLKDQFGQVVEVTNPDRNMHASWTGKLIGYRDHPCVTIEFENGQHMCLPADWVRPAKPTATEHTRASASALTRTAMQAGLTVEQSEQALEVGARFIAHGFTGKEIDQMILRHHQDLAESERQ